MDSRHLAGRRHAISARPTARAALSGIAALTGTLSLACGYGPEPPGPTPSGEVFATPQPSQPFISPTRSNDVKVEAHLKGQLQDVVLDAATVHNDGYLDAWNDGAHLGLNMAAEGQGGAGMIMLGLPGGVDHPVFAMGRWSSQLDAESASATEEWIGGPGGGETWVGSCAGPSLGNYPYEQTAIDYEMTAQPDPEDPNVVVVVIRASFDGPSSGSTTQVNATVRFTEFERLGALQLTRLEEAAAYADETGPAGPGPTLLR